MPRKGSSPVFHLSTKCQQVPWCQWADSPSVVHTDSLRYAEHQVRKTGQWREGYVTHRHWQGSLGILEPNGWRRGKEELYPDGVG